jgi:hypothetical protein
MHELLTWVSDHKNELVILDVSHVSDGQHNYVTDATQKVILELISVEESSYRLQFKEPENFTSPTKITLTAPITAEVVVADTSVTITYESTKGDVRLTITSLAKPKTKAIQSEDSDEAFVREIKGTQGELKKLIIHLPADTINEPLLNTAKEVLHKLLCGWQTISIAKRSAAQLTILHSRVKVEDIVLVYLPGDSFFQLSGKDGKEGVTLDISLDLFINLEKKSMSFTFDNVAYEIVKIA